VSYIIERANSDGTWEDMGRFDMPAAALDARTALARTFTEDRFRIVDSFTARVVVDDHSAELGDGGVAWPRRREGAQRD